MPPCSVLGNIRAVDEAVVPRRKVVRLPRRIVLGCLINGDVLLLELVSDEGGSLEAQISLCLNAGEVGVVYNAQRIPSTHDEIAVVSPGEPRR